MKCVYIILILIVSLPFLVQAAEITDGLVLYMPLDEGSGKEIEDLSNTKAKGELKGGKWVDGKFGKALQFKASTEHVLIPDNKAFISKAHLPKRLGSGWTDYQAHTPLSSVPGGAVAVLLVLVTA